MAEGVVAEMPTQLSFSPPPMMPTPHQEEAVVSLAFDPEKNAAALSAEPKKMQKGIMDELSKIVGVGPKYIRLITVPSPHNPMLTMSFMSGEHPMTPNEMVKKLKLAFAGDNSKIKLAGLVEPHALTRHDTSEADELIFKSGASLGLPGAEVLNPEASPSPAFLSSPEPEPEKAEDPEGLSLEHDKGSTAQPKAAAAAEMQAPTQEAPAEVAVEKAAPIPAEVKEADTASVSQSLERRHKKQHVERKHATHATAHATKSKLHKELERQPPVRHHQEMHHQETHSHTGHKRHHKAHPRAHTEEHRMDSIRDALIDSMPL